jgi:hypothetical protein
LFLTEERLTVWSAHEFSTAQEAFRDMCVLLEAHPDLDGQVQQIHRASGAEAIELKGDRRLRFKARTKGGGRGLTGNRIILDEAMYLRPEHMGALIPTLRAVRDPQLVYAGSAGLLESAEWRRVRDRGRAGADPSLAYIEWGDPDAWTGCGEGCSHAYGQPGCALDDEARWWATNTALTAGRITVDALRADRRTLPWLEFARETLGWWEDPPLDGMDEALANWPACHNPAAKASPTVHFGVDVSPNMASGAIVAASWDDQRTVVEVVEHRRGTAWIADRLAELMGKHQPVSVGLPETVVEIRAAETVAACATFARAVTDGQVSHLDDPRLNDAVAAARRRFAGDGWRWSRRDSDGDISPLYAATVARHLLATADGPYDPLANFLP